MANTASAPAASNKLQPECSLNPLAPCTPSQGENKGLHGARLPTLSATQWTQMVREDFKRIAQDKQVLECNDNKPMRVGATVQVAQQMIKDAFATEAFKKWYQSDSAKEFMKKIGLEGFNPESLKADGAYGNETKKAVAVYQLFESMQPQGQGIDCTKIKYDGKFGHETLEMLKRRSIDVNKITDTVIQGRQHVPPKQETTPVPREPKPRGETEKATPKPPKPEEPRRVPQKPTPIPGVTTAQQRIFDEAARRMKDLEVFSDKQAAPLETSINTHAKNAQQLLEKVTAETDPKKADALAKQIAKEDTALVGEHKRVEQRNYPRELTAIEKFRKEILEPLVTKSGVSPEVQKKAEELSTQLKQRMAALQQKVDGIKTTADATHAASQTAAAKVEVLKKGVAPAPEPTSWEKTSDEKVLKDYGRLHDAASAGPGFEAEAQRLEKLNSTVARALGLPDSLPITSKIALEKASDNSALHGPVGAQYITGTSTGTDGRTEKFRADIKFSPDGQAIISNPKFENTTPPGTPPIPDTDGTPSTETARAFLDRLKSSDAGAYLREYGQLEKVAQSPNDSPERAEAQAKVKEIQGELLSFTGLASEGNRIELKKNADGSALVDPSDGKAVVQGTIFVEGKELGEFSLPIDFQGERVARLAQPYKLAFSPGNEIKVSPEKDNELLQAMYEFVRKGDIGDTYRIHRIGEEVKGNEPNTYVIVATNRQDPNAVYIQVGETDSTVVDRSTISGGQSFRYTDSLGNTWRIREDKIERIVNPDTDGESITDITRR